VQIFTAMLLGSWLSEKTAGSWETSFSFVIMFGIILTWTKSREIKENLIFQNLEQQKEGKK